MGNLKIINTAERKSNESNSKPINTNARRKRYEEFVKRNVIVANFLMKISQIIFMLYIIFIDTDIVNFASRYTHETIKNMIPYVEQIWVYSMVVLVFIISLRNLRKYRRMLVVLRHNLKTSNNLIIPTNMEAYFKDALRQVFAALLTLSLFAIMNYWNGMSLYEHILSWYYTLTTIFYVYIHISQLIILHRKKREKLNDKFKPYW